MCCPHFLVLHQVHLISTRAHWVEDHMQQQQTGTAKLATEQTGSTGRWPRGEEHSLLL